MTTLRSNLVAWARRHNRALILFKKLDFDVAADRARELRDDFMRRARNAKGGR